MKRIITILGALIVLTLTVWVTRAQTIVPPLTFQSTVLHTSCVVVANVTQYCFAADGLWVSVTGGAFTQLVGVTSVSVCNAAGSACVSQTGVVTLNIPSKVVVVAPSATLQ